MNQDMKDLIKVAEDKGYSLVRYDEFPHKNNEDLKQRYLMVLQK